MANGPENLSSDSNPLKSLGSELSSLHLRQNADRADSVEAGMIAGDPQAIKDALAGVKQLLKESATLKERFDQAVAGIQLDLGYLPQIRLGSLTRFGLEPAVSDTGELTHQSLPALAEASQQVDHIELEDQPVTSDLAVNEPLLGFSVEEVDHRSVSQPSETVVVPAVEPIDDQPIDQSVAAQSEEALVTIEKTSVVEISETVAVEQPAEPVLTPATEVAQAEEISEAVSMVEVDQPVQSTVEVDEPYMVEIPTEAVQLVPEVNAPIPEVTVAAEPEVELPLAEVTASESEAVEHTTEIPAEETAVNVSPVVDEAISTPVEAADQSSQIEATVSVNPAQEKSTPSALELTGYKGKVVNAILEHGPIDAATLIKHVWPDEIGIVSNSALLQRAYNLLNQVRPILEEAGRPIQKTTDPETRKATYYFDKPVASDPGVEAVVQSPVEDSSAQLSTTPEQLVQVAPPLLEEDVVTETVIPVVTPEKSISTSESDQPEKIAAPFIPEITNPQQKVLDGYWSTVIEGSKTDLEAALEIYASDIGQVDEAQLVKRLGVYRSTMKPALAKLGITFVKTPIPGSRSGTYSLELTTQAKKKYAKEIKQAEEALKKLSVADEEPQTAQPAVTSSETAEVVEQSATVIVDNSSHIVVSEPVLSPAPEVLMESPVVAVADKIEQEEKSLVSEVGSGAAEVVSPVAESPESTTDTGETFPATGEIQFAEASAEPQVAVEVVSTSEDVDKLASQIDTSDIWHFLNFVSDLTSQDVEILARVGIKIPKSFDAINFFTKNNKQFGNQLAKTTFERNLAGWESKMVSLSRNFKDVMLKHANSQEVQIALFAIHGMIKNEDQMKATLSRRITR